MGGAPHRLVLQCDAVPGRGLQRRVERHHLQRQASPPIDEVIRAVMLEDSLHLLHGAERPDLQAGQPRELDRRRLPDHRVPEPLVRPA